MAKKALFPPLQDSKNSFNCPRQLEQFTSHFSKYRFSDLVDLTLLQELFASFYAATGVPHTVRDTDYTILTKAGWQDICTNFHRICPKTELRCRISDRFMEDHLQDTPYIIYKCLNGLMDGATPVVINGKHLATIFLGQVFFSPPDESFFRQQAREFGFDETHYLDAVHRVPIISREKMESFLDYHSKIGRILAEMGLERLNQLEAADRAIKEREERLSLALEASTDGFWDRNIEMNIIHFSPNWATILGYSAQSIELSTSSWELLIHPDDRRAVCNAIGEHLKGSSAKYEAKYRLRSKCGDWIWIHDHGKTVSRDKHGNPSRMAGTCFDITEQKQIEIEIARLDRLNLVGEMAASIGHEIRNPMTTVRGFLQMLKIWKDYKDWEDNADLIISELDRANAIITQFLSLAKNKAVELKAGDLGLVISAFIPLIQSDAVSRGMNVTFEVKDALWVLFNEDELRQLILNLSRNAMDATAPGGTVRISLYLEGKEAILTVQDHGHGISEEVLKKLGTPFFTTKEGGTGLGLAVCYGIANRHNARITLDTGAEGTTFVVRFPETEKQVTLL